MRRLFKAAKLKIEWNTLIWKRKLKIWASIHSKLCVNFYFYYYFYWHVFITNRGEIIVFVFLLSSKKIMICFSFLLIFSICIFIDLFVCVRENEHKQMDIVDGKYIECIYENYKFWTSIPFYLCCYYYIILDFFLLFKKCLSMLVQRIIWMCMYVCLCLFVFFWWFLLLLMFLFR